MKIIAFVPMKGNSERVPNKNLKSFDGRALYQIIVDEILKSKFINEVHINTDSDRIKESILSNYTSDRVKVIDRPQNLIGDFVAMNDILWNDINQVDADVYIQTHATNPLLRIETLDNAISFFLDNQGTYDSLFSVTKLQTRLYWEDGKAINHDPEILLRTQDLPVIYEENSNFYIFTKESFNKAGQKRIGLIPKLFPINKIEAHDIDELHDFILAELYYKTLKKESNDHM